MKTVKVPSNVASALKLKIESGDISVDEVMEKLTELEMSIMSTMEELQSSVPVEGWMRKRGLTKALAHYKKAMKGYELFMDNIGIASANLED